MSPELRNMLTLENDEYQCDLKTLLRLKDKVGIVLDVHHHWINTGEHISATDEDIKSIIHSWCRDGTDRRPVFHYSVSRERYFENVCKNTLPDMRMLNAMGHKRSDLRAHSDFFHHRVLNDCVRQHWDHFDCMTESKSKNLGAQQLFEQWFIY